jgi:hypothetical protein
VEESPNLKLINWKTDKENADLKVRITIQKLALDI